MFPMLHTQSRLLHAALILMAIAILLTAVELRMELARLVRMKRLLVYVRDDAAPAASGTPQEKGATSNEAAPGGDATASAEGEVS